MTEIMFRPIEDTDFDIVYDIYMDPVVNPYMSWEVMEKDSFRPIFDDFKSNFEFLAIQTSDGEFLGVIKIEFCKYRKSHQANLGSFGFYKKARGRGLAKPVMKALVKYILDKGRTRISLTVEADNPKALEIYKQCGFKVEGRLEKFFKRAGEDEYIDDIQMAYIA